VADDEAPHSHGTGMAGAIAARRTMLGIAPQSALLAVRAFSTGAASVEGTTFNILKGLDWAAAQGARVAAPGVDILVPAPDRGYQFTTGTSVAAAEVSGAAALLIERNPSLTPADVRKILMDTAKTSGSKEKTVTTAPVSSMHAGGVIRQTQAIAE
jgi:subtilisin family serine protease